MRGGTRYFSVSIVVATLDGDNPSVVEISLGVALGYLDLRMPYRAELTQQHGYLHAGAVTAVMDSACGYAALSLAPDDKDVLTVEFKQNLLAPAVGDALIAKGHVKRAGKTLTICTADALPNSRVSKGRTQRFPTFALTV